MQSYTDRGKEHKPREGTVYTRSRKGDVYELCLYH